MKDKKKDGKDYPGVAVDKADGGKATKSDVKNEPRRLNNNPRNNDM